MSGINARKREEELKERVRELSECLDVINNESMNWTGGLADFIKRHSIKQLLEKVNKGVKE